jgi:hypothetical protein
LPLKRKPLGGLTDISEASKSRVDIEALVDPGKRRLAQAKQNAQALFLLCAVIAGLVVLFGIFIVGFKKLSIDPPPAWSLLPWLVLALSSGWLAAGIESSPRSAVTVIPYWIISLLLAVGISYIRGQLSLFFLITGGLVAVVGFVLGERINRLAA